MKTCPYCMWELQDDVNQCSYCWKFVTIFNDENLKSDIDSKSVKSRWYFKWIWIIVLVLIIVFLVLPLIKKHFYSHMNVKPLNILNDDIIISDWDLEMSSTSEILNNDTLEDSIDDKLVEEFLELMNDFLNKISSFSGTLFYIDDKDLHNTDLINSSIIQLNDFSNSMTSYLTEFDKLSNKYWLFEDKSDYSFYEYFIMFQNFILQEVELSNVSAELYSYVLSIQDRFYYDENEDRIYFYNDASDYLIDQYVDLLEKHASSLTNYVEGGKVFREYHTKFLKYNNIVNNSY